MATLYASLQDLKRSHFGINVAISATPPLVRPNRRQLPYYFLVRPNYPNPFIRVKRSSDRAIWGVARKRSSRVVAMGATSRPRARRVARTTKRLSATSCASLAGRSAGLRARAQRTKRAPRTRTRPKTRPTRVPHASQLTDGARGRRGVRARRVGATGSTAVHAGNRRVVDAGRGRPRRVRALGPQVDVDVVTRRPRGSGGRHARRRGPEMRETARDRDVARRPGRARRLQPRGRRRCR